MQSQDYIRFVVDHRIKILHSVSDTFITLNESFNNMLAVESKNIKLVCDNRENSNLNSNANENNYINHSQSDDIHIYGLKMNYDDNIKEIEDASIYISNLTLSDSIRAETNRLLDSLINTCKSFSSYVKMPSIIYRCINFVIGRLHFVSSSVAVLKIELSEKHESKTLKKIYASELNTLKYYIANMRACGEIARLVDKLFISDELLSTMKFIVENCIRSMIKLYEIIDNVISTNTELFYKIFVHKSFPIENKNLKSIIVTLFNKHEQIFDYDSWVKLEGENILNSDESMKNICNGDQLIS